MTEHTTDTLAGGRIVFEQPKDGYRFGIDAVLLGAGTSGLDPEKILDAGCGVGVVGILAARHHRNATLIGVEIQSRLSSFAQKNLLHSGLAERAEIICGDLRALAKRSPLRGSVDLALLNPPYFPAGTGHLNPHGERAAARHELNGDLIELIDACRCSLSKRGMLRIIYPAAHTPRLILAVQEAGMKPQRMRAIHSFKDKAASLLLLDASCRGKREMAIEPSMTLFSSEGVYTDEVACLLNGDAVSL